MSSGIEGLFVSVARKITVTETDLNCEYPEVRAREARIAAIIATFADPLVTLLRESKREHDDGESIDCSMANPEYAYNKGEPCTCGADAWNAKVDAVLAGDTA